MNYEIIGLAATLLIFCGFLCTGERKIRLFDLAGCVLYIVYGALIKSLSVLLLNGSLIFVHAYKLFKMRRGG